MTDQRTAQPVLVAAKNSGRVWIENVKPRIDGGRFPAKRTVGETVRVSALTSSSAFCTLAAIK